MGMALALKTALSKFFFKQVWIVIWTLNAGRKAHGYPSPVIAY